MDLNNTYYNVNDFKSECKRYSKLATEFIDRFNSHCIKVRSEVVKNEYASGGELMARGYYCPSPIYDIIVGNCKRGKLIKRITSQSKPTYQYGFDDKSRLITITQFSNNAHFADMYEIIEYSKNASIGFTFQNKPNLEIRKIIECIYDCNNRIVSFTIALGNVNGTTIDEVYKELYSYDKSGLHLAQVYEFLAISSNILSCNEYVFSHNDEGYLKEYTINNSVYKVDHKRKV